MRAAHTLLKPSNTLNAILTRFSPQNGNKTITGSSQLHQRTASYSSTTLFTQLWKNNCKFQVSFPRELASKYLLRELPHWTASQIQVRTFASDMKKSSKKPRPPKVKKTDDQKQWKVKGLNKPRDENGNIIESPYDQLLNKVSTSMGNDLEDTAVPRITVEELRELLLKDSENVVLVDLRDEDYGEPKIEGAIKNKVPPFRYPAPHEKTPASKITEERENPFKAALEGSEEMWNRKFTFPKVEPDDPKTIVFYSNTGRRSDWLTRCAVEVGYKNVKSLIGGARLYNKYYNPFFKPAA